MTVIIITRCCCAFKSTEPIQKQSRVQPCASHYDGYQSYSVCFASIKKPSVWLTLNSFSPWSASLFASHKGYKNSTEMRENVQEETFRCTFSTEIGISRLESCKTFTYQIIACSFGGKQCNIWFFSALNRLVFLSTQVRSSAVACNWITARFCLCVCFIPYDSSIYSFFWGANNDE